MSWSLCPSQFIAQQKKFGTQQFARMTIGRAKLLIEPTEVILHLPIDLKKKIIIDSFCERGILEEKGPMKLLEDLLMVTLKGGRFVRFFFGLLIHNRRFLHY